ncbi:MAG: purine-nucleoside phosphorylase [Rhodothermaceae bacterium]|nr:purine-nucleoside phosphorylase [Rhodothermaceae bacterium]MXX59691.1 purine-nucleoside phosphorylase [Rhodothermaceae bacterium]MYD18966.1 purine-nucleoside phosphorylase [Rhodothermaceae bacterium]MYD56970.1 purine-nucleoside phosphorylase [Rhodothermaceae bacterium]MYI42818.1 purine-nucleoside phosphorylase [Rhodothermaceae bacterium]
MEANIPDSETQVARVDAAIAAVRAVTDSKFKIGLILGTGLGKLAERIDVQHTISYDSIPHFPVSTVESHQGRLLIGTLEGVSVICMQGRMHVYEGYSAREATFPIRVVAGLGIECLLITTACGGMNPAYRRGDLMLLSDHINLQGVNPLVGPNVDAWGPRFPDMSEPYDVALRARAKQIADEHAIKLHEGVYVSVLGPNLETKAEYRFLRAIGADVVGMSTTPEVTVARHMDLRVMAIGVITDECFPDTLQPVTLEEVLEAAGIAEPKLTTIMSEVVVSLDEDQSR